MDSEPEPVGQNESGWWTDRRVEIWERIDQATADVVESYDDRRLIGGLSLHVSAPNPDGINADMSPDEWYVTLPYGEGEVDVETVAGALSDALDAPITIRPRSDGWEPGIWLIVDNAASEVGCA